MYLEKGVNPNLKDKTKQAALHLLLKNDAVTKEKVEIVRLLMKAGASPNEPDPLGKSPLMILVACADPNPEIAKALLESGADPNQQEPTTGVVPLTLCCKLKNRKRLMQYLLEHGADPDIKDKVASLSFPFFIFQFFKLIFFFFFFGR